MRRAVLAVVLVLAGSGSGLGQMPDLRMTRVEQWLKGVMDHEPGTTDQAAALVASWSAQGIRTLWIDANVIAQLMRDPRKSSFSVKAEHQPTSQPIRYSTVQLRRIQGLACAAAGNLTHPACVEIRAAASLDADLLRLSNLVAASRLAGDDNFLLRRGALLHADIAMLMPDSAEPVSVSGLQGGPQRIRIQTSDGMALGIGQLAPHWELARMLLDFVRPPGAANPAPGSDEMVRLWYRSTAAWMQAHEQHDTDHLDRARAIFPNDADILFLSASQHEVYAGAPVQSALRAMPVPTGMRSDISSERTELHQAESFFRRAIAASPAMSEAHLRYGRVLFRLERYGEAISELHKALASIDDDDQRYYGELFLGAAETARRNIDAARGAYGRAAKLRPQAQSPRIGLSELARRLGDRGGAFRELQVVFDQPAIEAELTDPWWKYYVVQARNADDLLETLRRPFRHDP
jgi:tetratricopeptide (TPR) repeat protein